MQQEIKFFQHSDVRPQKYAHFKRRGQRHISHYGKIPHASVFLISFKNILFFSTKFHALFLHSPSKTQARIQNLKKFELLVQKICQFETQRCAPSILNMAIIYVTKRNHRDFVNYICTEAQIHIYLKPYAGIA